MSGGRPLPPAWRLLWLLTRLRLLRLLNLLGGLDRLPWRRGAHAKAPGPGEPTPASASPRTDPRTGTRRKGRLGLPMALVVGGLMLLAFGSMAHQSVRNLKQALVVQPQLDAEAPGAVNVVGEKFFTTAAAHAAARDRLVQALAGLVALMGLVALCNELGSRELARPEWDMEWLVTLPVGMTTLLWARLVERSVTSVVGLLALPPLLTVLARQQGAPWWAAPCVGLVAALPMLALAALLRSMVDIGLRLRLAPAQLRNLQAVMSVLGVLCLYLSLSVASSHGGASLGVAWVARTPAWVLWTPPGLVVQALHAGTVGQGAGWMLAAAAQTAALLALGVAWMRHQLRRGLVSGGSREAVARHAARAGAPPRWLGLIRSPVQRRELRLLARDRNFLVQTLLLPVLIIGSQLVLNGGGAAVGHLLSGSPALVASVAFGLGSYMLMMSAFQTLNTEGAALWLLYTFPRSVGQVLRDKAALWAVLALVYPAAVLLPGAWYVAPGAGWAYLGKAALALAGVPLFAAIAVSLAVFASDPQAEQRSTRLRPGYVYLFMLLSGFYGYGVLAAQWWQSLVILLLVGLLALALWQKANDALPFLLDPVAAPPSQPSAADGLMAALAFLLLQLGLAALCGAVWPGEPGAALLVSFVGAGAVTYGLARLAYWRLRARGVPPLLAPRGTRAAALRQGVAWGALAAALGLAYRQLGLLPAPVTAGAPAWSGGLLLVLGVLAAPLFEEFIFRGLVFTGLRRSLPWWPAAAASAAVFAVVHPPVSMIPVFALGLCAAAACERGKGLLAPVTVHAVYNAAVLGAQLAWPSA